MIRRIVITCLGRLNGIGRCQPGRAPELRAFGSYSVALAAIISRLELGPYMADTGMGFPNVTDHGGRKSPRGEPARAQLQNPAPAALYGWLRPMPSSRTQRPARTTLRLSSTRTSVRQPQRVAPSGAPHLARRREP
jgi:hypothetical protein